MEYCKVYDKLKDEYKVAKECIKNKSGNGNAKCPRQGLDFGT